mgnify:FL=1
MKKELKGLSRGEVVSLYSAIRDIKSGNLDKEAMVAYVLLRVKLKSIHDDFEKARAEISEQTKPAGWKEGDSVTEWNKSFSEILQKWLDEKTDIEAKILSTDGCISLITSNPDLPGSVGDMIMMFLNK